MRVAHYIEALESRLLRWMRLISVVATALMLVVGVWVLVTSLAKLGASAESTLEDVANPTFVDPGIHNVEVENTPEPKDQDIEEEDPKPVGPDLERGYPSYDWEADQVVASLRPLMDAMDTNIDLRQLRKYTQDIMDLLDESILSVTDAPEHDAAVVRLLDGAVAGMIVYAQQFSEHYGEEIGLSAGDTVGRPTKTIHPEFKEHLAALLRNPLGGYVARFDAAMKASAANTEAEAIEAAATVAEGEAGLESVPYIGLLVLAMLFLLLLFKIEIRLGDGQEGN